MGNAPSVSDKEGKKIKISDKSKGEKPIFSVEAEIIYDSKDISHSISETPIY
jgi:hypothetical protein